ncbi:MAG TPA: hypothetical protein VFC39_14230 [Acidobacteriaceae bacterium]|nr:hypothetical protein [Acidobacteriaceae bacterium]
MEIGSRFRNTRKRATQGRELTVFLLLSAAALAGFGQGNPRNSRVDAAVTVGILNSQYPSYADNAAGPEIAVFYQRSTLLGLQVEGGDFLYSARFKQVPVTAGYQIGRPSHDGDTSLWTGWNPFAYAGAGFSNSRDIAATNFPAPATWDFCMQGSAGIDHPSKYFTWRIVELSWTETSTLPVSIRSLGASTGLVFHLLR